MTVTSSPNQLVDVPINRLGQARLRHLNNEAPPSHASHSYTWVSISQISEKVRLHYCSSLESSTVVGILNRLQNSFSPMQIK